MLETEVAIEHAGARLAGTVVAPGVGRFPTVLMLHGSGPLDRNEDMPGQRLSVFNTFAERLVRNGVASLRFDKRGCGASTGDFETAGVHDAAADAVAWIDWLVRADFCDPEQLILLGHSEGCLIAPLAIKQRPSVSGAVLICPFAERVETILMRQAAHVESELGWLLRVLARPVPTQRRLLERAKASTEPSFRVRGQRINAKWLRELLAIDPAEALSQMTCPTLLIGGAHDRQCDPEDVARAAALLRGPVQAHVVPELTHVLRRGPPTLLRQHRLLGEPVDERVLDLLAAWFRKTTSRQ
jgi:pimeloyl-ACP methyl ester carboxylesterase